MKILSNVRLPYAEEFHSIEPIVLEEIHLWSAEDVDLFVVSFEKENAREVLNSLCKRKEKIPVIGISSQESGFPGLKLETTFLFSGGEYLLPKDYEPEDLLVRIYKAGVRKDSLGDAVIRLCEGNFVFNKIASQCTAWGKSLNLTRSEWKVLSLLLKEPGKLYSKTDLSFEVYGGGNDGPNCNTIDVFLCRLRKCLDEARPGLSKLIQTQTGKGYRINPDFTDSE